MQSGTGVKSKIISKFNTNNRNEDRNLYKLPSFPKRFSTLISVSYTHLRAPRDRTRSRMPSSA